MDLKLYVVEDGDNVLNKTLSDELIIQINLKRDVNLFTPSLIIRDSSEIDINRFNYCVIPVLNRNYFIRTINNIGNDLWRLDCECDVLETYKSDVLASKARFNRAIKTGDYFMANIDQSVIKTITKHESNVTIGDESSMILTSVGEV